MARSNSKYLAPLIVIIIIAVLFAVPLILRMRLESSLHLSKARVAASEARFEQASESYRKSISWRSPFDSASRAASIELFELAGSPKLSPEQKLFALEELRRGLASSRSWWWTVGDTWASPSATAVQEAINRISPPPPDYVHEAHPPSVDFFFQALSQCFFWAWILCTLWAIWKGFTPSGSVRIRELLPRLACAAACFVVWMLALVRA